MYSAGRLRAVDIGDLQPLNGHIPKTILISREILRKKQQKATWPIGRYLASCRKTSELGLTKQFAGKVSVDEVRTMTMDLWSK